MCILYMYRYMCMNMYTCMHADMYVIPSRAANSPLFPASPHHSPVVMVVAFGGRDR